MTVLVVDSGGTPVPVQRLDSEGDLQQVTIEELTGVPGLDGAGVLHGTGNPTGGDGVLDDFWINTTAWTIFGPKTGGGWGSGVSLVGPAGTLADGSVTLAKLAAALKPSGTAAAGDEAVRALGTSSSTACAGNDSRLSDTRTPTDASVTLAKIAAALKPSGTAAAGDEALRALGTTAATAAAGNDARLTDRNEYTFAISTPAAATLPGYFISIGSGRTKKLIKIRHRVDTGTTTTFYVRRNGTAISGYGTSGSPLTASNNASGQLGADTDAADVTLADNDYIDVVIVAAGTATILTVTVVVEVS